MHVVQSNQSNVSGSPFLQAIGETLVFEIEMSTAQLFRGAIAKPLSKLTKINESSILNTLSTPKVSLQHQFGIPVPRLIAHLETNKPQNAKAYCQELSGKVVCQEQKSSF